MLQDTTSSATIDYPALYIPSKKVYDIIKKMIYIDQEDHDEFIMNYCFPNIDEIEFGVSAGVIDALKEKGYDVTDEGFEQIPEEKVIPWINMMWLD